MHFGVPVVPEEYAIMKGSRNVVVSKQSTFDVAFLIYSCKVIAMGTIVISACFLNLGSEITPAKTVSVFIPFTISVIFCRRSIVLPLYTVQSSTNMYYQRQLQA